MEYMNGGCFTDVLEQFDKVQMSEPQIALVCRQVLFLLINQNFLLFDLTNYSKIKGSSWSKLSPQLPSSSS